MSQSIGQKLAAARQKRGASIEDVAHVTRIHPGTLRQLEADDYSGFTNLTYARSFLSLYSRHLDVDVSDALKHFAPAVGNSTEGASPGAPDALTSDAMGDSFRPHLTTPPVNPRLNSVAIIALILALPFAFILGKRSGFKAAREAQTQTQTRPASAPQSDPSPPAAAEPPAPEPDPLPTEPQGGTAPVVAKPAVIADPPPESVPAPNSEAPPVEVRRPSILTDERAE